MGRDIAQKVGDGDGREGAAGVRGKEDDSAAQVLARLEADRRNLEFLPKMAEQLVGGDGANLREKEEES